MRGVFTTIVMETNIEQRSAIELCWKAGKTGAETYKLLRKVYGEECVSRATMFLWFSKFRDGCEDVHDDEQAGRPHTSRTDNIAAVRAALQHDCRLTVHLLEEQLHINREMICHIITKDMGKKICACFVPHTLTAEQKADHVASCKDFLAVYRRDPAFLITIVMGRNCDVLRKTRLLNDRVRNGRARGLRDHKTAVAKIAREDDVDRVF